MLCTFYFFNKSQTAIPGLIKGIYILTKRLLKKNIELHNSLLQKKSGTTVLIDLLFVVSIYRFYKEVTKLHDYLSNSKFDELKEELKSKCPEKGEMCAAVIAGIEKIASDELIELLILIEIVVAY